MELRQRKRGVSRNYIRAGEAAGRRSNDGAEEGTADDRRVVENDDVPTASDATDAVVGAAVRGGSLLMLLALIQRASTFVLNVLLQRAMLSGTDTSHNSRGQEARPTSALEHYGAAAITLELISSTALFLAREPFRVALARSRVPQPEAMQHSGGEETASDRVRREEYRRRFVNTAWLSAPVGLAFAAVVRLTYPWIIRNDAFDGVEENRQAATMVCIAAAVELMCEPLALIFQYRLLIHVRVRAEAAAVLVLGVSRYLLVTRAGMGVLSFGYAQLLHSVTLASVYIFSAARDVATATAAQAVHRPSQKETVVHYSQGFARVRGWLPGRPNTSAGDRNGRSHSEKIRDGTDGWVDNGKLKLAGALAGQSLLKHVLTEGDKIVLARATSLGPGCVDGGHGSGGVARTGCGQGGSLYEQGVYAVASGYGSLAARLLFQPVEEAARLMFSKLGAEEDSTKGSEETTAMRSANETNESCSGRVASLPRTDVAPTDVGGDGRSHAGRRLRERMAVLLATLLKLVLTAGLVFVCFGFHYTETLLRLLLASRGGGERGGSTAVSEVARVLSWYCVYVLFLAANGMCEAFACAVARGRQLSEMGAGLVASFAVFWMAVGTLTGRFGTRGLVMANAAGMACRVICSAVFIRRFFLQKPAGAGVIGQSSHTTTEKNLWRQVVNGALPHPAVFAAMAASSVLAYAASPAQTAPGGAVGGGDPWSITAASRHVGVGAACFALTAAVFVRFERRFLREMGALWAARRRNRGLSGEADGRVSGEAGDGRYKGD